MSRYHLTNEDMKILKAKYPKFSKVQKCMIENPEYGVELSSSARKYLKKQKGIPTMSRTKYSPCYQCEKREIKCHEKCEDFQQYRKNLEEFKEKCTQMRKQYLNDYDKDTWNRLRGHMDSKYRK